MRSIRIFSIAALLSLSAPGFTETLSDSEINKWVNAATALQSWGKQQHSKEFVPEGSEVIAMKNPAHAFSLSINEAKKTPHFKDIQGVLKQNGYSDADKWAQTGDRIMTAHVANSMAKHKEMTPEAMGAAMQEVQNNPNIPANIRAQMEQAMQGSQAMIKSAQDAPAEDKASVQRNAKVLEQFFKAK